MRQCCDAPCITPSGSSHCPWAFSRTKPARAQSTRVYHKRYSIYRRHTGKPSRPPWKVYIYIAAFFFSRRPLIVSLSRAVVYIYAALQREKAGEHLYINSLSLDIDDVWGAENVWKNSSLLFSREISIDTLFSNITDIYSVVARSCSHVFPSATI